MAGQRVEVTGEVLEADVKQRKFQLWIDGQTHVLVMSSALSAKLPMTTRRHPSRRFWRVWRVGCRRLNGTSSPAT